MLNQFGKKIIGHGVIHQISIPTLEAQLHKMSLEAKDYNRRILEEFRTEQPEFYKLVEGIAKKFAVEWANYSDVKGTTSWNDCVNYWTVRLIDIMSFQYKLISLGVEQQLMEENIVL